MVKMLVLAWLVLIDEDFVGWCGVCHFDLSDVLAAFYSEYLI